MMLTRSVFIFVVFSAWSIHQTESSIAFNRSECSDVSRGYQGMIRGGRIAPRNQWPWLVALFQKTENEFLCGGSLISERFVLTAAHCIQNKEEEAPRDPKDVDAHLGKWNLSDATEPNAVLATPEEFIVHSDWDVNAMRWDADIAIVKLADDVKLSKSIQPICLWTPQMQPNSRHDGGMVVGWGQTDNQRNGEHSDILRDVETKVLPIGKCHEIAILNELISDRGLCVGGNGAGACEGDSGGGLFTAQGRKWFLRGITSVSLTNVVMKCDVHSPEIFTNVEKFTPWIDQVLDGDEQLKCAFEIGKLSDPYACSLQNAFTRRDTKIFQVSGSHVGGRTNADVRVFGSWRNSKLKFLPIALGRFFPNLEEYLVERSGVEEISRQNFAVLPKLKFLFIVESLLKVIAVDAFYDLMNLEELMLDYNQIEAIDSSTFIRNTKLRKINLQKNKITSLDSLTFSNNLELESIDLSDNSITKIGPDLLTPLKKLHEVDLRNNICIDEYWFDSPFFNSSQKEEMKETFASQCP